MSTRTFLITLPVILSAACAANSSTNVTRSKTLPMAPNEPLSRPKPILLDEQGNVAGKHYAGPHWEAGDGSKIIGTVRASAAAPRADSIPWLLLDARSVGVAGRLGKVTSVQRINTAGGKAPSTGCTASALGQTVRVPYTADYAMFAR
jgi:hypothetical protein